MSLHHYTSEDSFEGIVLDNTIRLTLSTQSNDCKDTIYIHELIRDNKEKFYIEDMPDHSRVIDCVLDSFSKLKDRVLATDIDDNLFKAFVLCFTDKGDDKDMWEGYNKNVGYSLELDLNALKLYTNSEQFAKEIRNNANVYVMTSVIYDKENQIQIIKDVIDTKYKEFLDNKDETLSDLIKPIVLSYNFKFSDPSDENFTYETEPKYTKITLKKRFIDLINDIYSQLLLIAPLIKNPYWKSENETRLIFLRLLKDDSLEEIKINENRNYYINFKIDKSLIKGIKIAPLNNKSIDQVKKELINAGYDMN